MMCPQRERDLAAVMEVMFDGAPDNPLTREAVINTMVLQNLQNHASYLDLQNYAPPKLKLYLNSICLSEQKVSTFIKSLLLLQPHF
jgi:hypothetical protein